VTASTPAPAPAAAALKARPASWWSKIKSFKPSFVNWWLAAVPLSPLLFYGLWIVASAAWTSSEIARSIAHSAATTLNATSSTYVEALSLVNGVLAASRSLGEMAFVGIDITDVHSSTLAVRASAAEAEALEAWMEEALQQMEVSDPTMDTHLRAALRQPPWWLADLDLEYNVARDGTTLEQHRAALEVAADGRARLTLQLRRIRFKARWVNPIWEILERRIPESEAHAAAARLLPPWIPPSDTVWLGKPAAWHRRWWRWLCSSLSDWWVKYTAVRDGGGGAMVVHDEL